MTDPANPDKTPRVVKNPPKEARTRAPRAPAAPPADAAAPAAAAAAQQSGGNRSRSMVCPSCGKYFDITRRPVGSTFDCKCGATLTVPPLSDKPPDYRPPEVTLKLRELRARHAWSIAAAVLGFAASVGLGVTTFHLLVRRELYVNGTCAGLAAVAFLVVGIIGVFEMRRTKEEIAAEAGGGAS